MKRASLTRLTRLGRIAWLICLSLLPALLAAAQAQTKRNDCESAPECARLLEQGIGDYQQRRYTAALPSFEKAYGLSSDPRLLVLMGRTRFKLGDTPGALDYYARARSQLVGAADRAKLEQYLAEARGESGAAPVPPAPRPNGTAVDATDSSPATLAPKPPASAETAGLSAPPAAPEKTKLKPWVWAVIGVGAAVVVATGIGLGVYYGTGTPVPDATVRFP